MAAEVRCSGPLTCGIQHRPFENRGTGLRFEAPRRLSYTHSSSLSRLPHEPESYTTLDFRLSAGQNTTALTLVMTGFPTLTIFKHMQFYWQGTLDVLKQHAERHWAATREHDHEIPR